MRNAALLAAPFDATRAEVVGPAVPLLAGVMQSTNAPNGNDETGMGQFAISDSGILIYASGDRYPTPSSTLVRVDRKGTETKLAEVKGDTYGIRISPSGSRLLAIKTNDGSRASDLWMYELPSGAATRITSTADSSWPLFSLDGRSVWFTRFRSNGGIFSSLLDSNDTPQRMMESTSAVPAAFSRDEKWLAYLDIVGSGRQILVRSMRDSKLESEARRFSPSTFDQRDVDFSPDGRWVVYTSNESGDYEVYVQAFPGPGEKHRISSNGGGNPAWSSNGRELFYLGRPAGGGKTSMIAVDVSTTATSKRALHTHGSKQDLIRAQHRFAVMTWLPTANSS